MRRKDMRIVTDEETEAARSPKGGWTKATLASWVVEWPPVKGWRTALRLGKRLLVPLAALERMLSGAGESQTIDRSKGK